MRVWDGKRPQSLESVPEGQASWRVVVEEETPMIEASMDWVS